MSKVKVTRSRSKVTRGKVKGQIKKTAHFNIIFFQVKVTMSRSWSQGHKVKVKNSKSLTLNFFLKTDVKGQGHGSRSKVTNGEVKGQISFLGLNTKIKLTLSVD